MTCHRCFPDLDPEILFRTTVPDPIRPKNSRSECTTLHTANVLLTLQCCWYFPPPSVVVDLPTLLQLLSSSSSHLLVLQVMLLLLMLLLTYRRCCCCCCCCRSLTSCCCRWCCCCWCCCWLTVAAAVAVVVVVVWPLVVAGDADGEQQRGGGYAGVAAGRAVPRRQHGGEQQRPQQLHRDDDGHSQQPPQHQLGQRHSPAGLTTTGTCYICPLHWSAVSANTQYFLRIIIGNFFSSKKAFFPADLSSVFVVSLSLFMCWPSRHFLLSPFLFLLFIIISCPFHHSAFYLRVSSPSPPPPTPIIFFPYYLANVTVQVQV